MKIFIDSADPVKIIDAWNTGMVDGVTTNPTLATLAKVPFKEAVSEILKVVKGPVSLEVTSLDTDGMVEEGRKLAALGKQVVVKLPMSVEAIKAIPILKKQGIKVNVTLVFSVAQALLAAKAGAEYVSPFMGRLDDIGEVGLELIAEIKTLYQNFGYTTQILAASERTVRECIDAGLIGADIVTMRYETFMSFFKHPLTDIGIARFSADWKSSKQEPLV